MIKLYVGLLAISAATPALAADSASRAPRSVQENEMNAQDKTKLLKKLAGFRKEISGADSATFKASVKHALKDVRAVDLRCDSFSPTTDQGKKFVMDCTARFNKADRTGLVEINFGANGQLAETAKITDVTYKTCANTEVQNGTGGGPAHWCPEEIPHPVGLPVHRGKDAPRPVGLPVHREEEAPRPVGMPAPRGEEPVRVGMPAPRGEEPVRVGMPAPRGEESHSRD